MKGFSKINTGATALALVVTVLLFIPIFLVAGYGKVVFTLWLVDNVEFFSESGFFSNLILVLVPEFLQGLAAGFLSLYFATHWFQNSHALSASIVVSTSYLGLTLFVLSSGYEPPPHLAVYEIGGLLANTFGVIFGFGAIAFEEIQILRIKKRLEKLKQK